MKTKLLLIIALCAIGIAFNDSSGQPQVPTGTKELMREKLAHAQKLLEALALEDFNTIRARAETLSEMTRGVHWQAFQNPDYVEFSAAFRRHANAIAKAAREKNIDAATLGYMRMTGSCMDCHKFVRGKLVGSLESKSSGTYALRCSLSRKPS
jgi:hypothetical protein